MEAELSARAHAILSRVIDLDRAQREAMVSSACVGNAPLEARVRRLLRAADRSDGFLERPALAAGVDPYAGVPDAVGNYLVVGVLGVGGMATVYEAVQENPHRRVALKVMHQSMSRSESLVRFRLEAQTLARLRHPGIAQIYEAGTARLGQPTPLPFFAMELVPDAMSLTQYAERHALPLRRRLEMFAAVCDAVLHGHQIGVIHRDLKPANVLVGPDGHAKVIDFGIARSVESGGASPTASTDTRRLIGTLNAMSPEQCANPADVDVRSDVYSLGVLLYELVTGRLPHDLSKCSIPRAVQIITEEEPAPASVHQPLAKGDLDAIIAKAMNKDRNRRYVGAGALAADIRRHLNHQAIEARRQGVAERVKKFVRRNPPLAAALAAVIVLLVGGIVVSTSFAYAATRARDAALQRERELAAVTEFQESLLSDIDLSAMGDGIRESFERSMRGQRGAEAIEGARLEEWRHLTESVNFTNLAKDSLNQSVLQRYARALDSRFADQPLLRARLLQKLADTMRKLGMGAEAEPMLRQALDLRLAQLGPDHNDTMQSTHALGSLLSTLGRFDEALVILRDLHERCTRLLGPDHRSTLLTGTSLGGVYRKQGNLEQAERIWGDTLQRQRATLGDDNISTLRSLNNMGVLYAVQGRLDDAEAAWREVVERRRRIFGEDDPEYRGALGNLGTLLLDRGHFEAARPLLEAALASDRRHLGDSHPDTLRSIGWLASLLRETGDVEAAEKLQRECYAGRRAVLGAENPDTLLAQVALASILHARDRTAEAEKMIRDALAIQQRTLGEKHTDTIESLGALRDVVADGGRLDEAIELGGKVIVLTRESPAGEPFAMGQHLSRQGALLMTAGKDSEADGPLHEGYAMLIQSLGAAHPQTRAAAGRLAEFYRRADAAEPGAGHDAEAAEWSLKASLPEQSKPQNLDSLPKPFVP